MISNPFIDKDAELRARCQYEPVFEKYGIRVWGKGLLWGNRPIGWLPELYDELENRYDIPVWETGAIVRAVTVFFKANQ